MLCVTNQDEYDYVYSADRNRWIGLNDASVEGKWEWDGPCNSSFVHWSTQDSNSGTKDYAYMSYNYYYNKANDGFFAAQNDANYDVACGCEVGISLRTPTAHPSFSSNMADSCQNDCYGQTCLYWDDNFGTDPFR